MISSAFRYNVEEVFFFRIVEYAGIEKTLKY